MTLLTTDNEISYNGLVGNDTFAYTFRVELQTDMIVTLDNAPVAQGDFTMTGLGTDIGGNVVLNTPLIADATVVLQRVVPATQEVDYVPFDAFPSETHEGALDKLTMLAQQNSNAINRSLRFPAGDPAGIILPDVATRALKYFYYTADGEPGVINAPPDPVSLLSINVASDSVNMLGVDYVALGPQHPTLQMRNINQPTGILQLTDQGKIPPGLINFIGLQLRGTFRGDDLCDKAGDSPGDCVPPDTRNPSQRSPTLDPTFANGDYFIITMQAPEVAGTMDLFLAVGDATSAIIPIAARDGVLFLEELEDPNSPGTILVQRGWYWIEQLVDTGDATFIVYDPAGNTYVLGNNVQVALDSVDAELIARDAFYLTQKNANRFALPVPGADLNTVGATGIYSALSTDANIPAAQNYTILHQQYGATEASQVAINVDAPAQVSTRVLTAGVWGIWGQLADRAYADTKLPLAGGELSGSLIINATVPILDMYAIGAIAEQGNWRWTVNANGSLFLNCLSDDLNTFTPFLQLIRIGQMPDVTTLFSNLTVGNGVTGGTIRARAQAGQPVEVAVQNSTAVTAGALVLAADGLTVSIERFNPADTLLQTALTLDAVGNVSVNAPVPINNIDLANKGYVDDLFATLSTIIIGSLAADGSIVFGSGFTVVVNAVGQRTIVFDTPMANINYMVQLTGTINPVAPNKPILLAFNRTISGFDIQTTQASGADINVGIDILIMVPPP